MKDPWQDLQTWIYLRQIWYLSTKIKSRILLFPQALGLYDWNASKTFAEMHLGHNNYVMLLVREHHLIARVVSDLSGDI